MSNAITVQGLSKRYGRYHSQRPTTLKGALLHGVQRMRPQDQFWVLRDVSFQIPEGRTVGVIGPNGAGKSTLLRLLGGVGRPERGAVRVRGRVGALLELGAGFHPELTGKENVFINGTVAGLTRRDVADRYDAIVAFAELAHAMDNPFRTFSTGMQMRLAFAVAVHTEPKVLLIDEVLAVGDAAFQRKCRERIEQFQAGGCTIVIVSHDAEATRRLCHDVIWLRGGELVAHGPTDVVLEQYLAEMTVETRRRTPADAPAVSLPSGRQLRINENRFGSLEATIRGVRVVDDDGYPTASMSPGSGLRIELEYETPVSMSPPIVGVSITRADGVVCLDLNTHNDGVKSPPDGGRSVVAMKIDRLDLAAGDYFVNVGLFEANWAYTFDYHWRVYPFTVASGAASGVIYPPHHWEVTPCHTGGRQITTGADLSPTEQVNA